MFRKIVLTLVGFIVSLATLEIVIRATDLDVKEFWPTAYFVEGDFSYKGGVELYRPSENAERVYELIPQSKAICTQNCRHKDEVITGDIELSVNEFGFRGRRHSLVKAENVYRILVLGGSNTFGVSVSDDGTYPALLEKKLNEMKLKKKVEVWNAGLSAYVMSQKVAYARELIPRLAPDLVIVQDANSGRRAFFYRDEEYNVRLKRNRDLWLESIPLLIKRGDEYPIWHRFFVLRSAFYRYFWLMINRNIIRSRRASCEKRNTKLFCMHKIHALFSAYAQEISRREWLKVVEEYPDIPWLRLDTIGKKYCKEERQKQRCSNGSDCPNVRNYSICDQRPGDEYFDIHPPQHVYEWLVERLAPSIAENYILFEGSKLNR